MSTLCISSQIDRTVKHVLFHNFRSDSLATNDLLANSIGKDLSSEVTNPVHRSALEYIASHLKIGKFASNDNEEKVSRLSL